MVRCRCGRKRVGNSACAVLVFGMFLFGVIIVGMISGVTHGVPRHGKEFVDKWLPAKCMATDIFTEQHQECCSSHHSSNRHRYHDDDDDYRRRLSLGSQQNDAGVQNTAAQADEVSSRELGACSTNYFAAYKVEVQLTSADGSAAQRITSQQCGVSSQGGAANHTITYGEAYSCELGSQKCSRARGSSCSKTSCEYVDNDPEDCAAPLHDSCMGYLEMDGSGSLRSRVGVWLPCWVYGPNPQRTTYSNPRSMLNPPSYQLWLAAVIVLCIALCCVCRCAGKAAHNKYKMRRGRSAGASYSALAEGPSGGGSGGGSATGAATVAPGQPPFSKEASATFPPPPSSAPGLARGPSSTWEGVFPFSDTPKPEAYPPAPPPYSGGQQQPWAPMEHGSAYTAPTYPPPGSAGVAPPQYPGTSSAYPGVNQSHPPYTGQGYASPNSGVQASVNSYGYTPK